MHSPLFEALRAADVDTPRELELFDRTAASGEPLPDFYEHSLRLPYGSSRYRLTNYFDVHRRGADVAREGGVRFIALCRQLGLSLPAALSAFVCAEARGGAEVLQVVLGIEAQPGGLGVRGKYYLVFRDNPMACVMELAGALGLELPSGVNPSRVYILGVDVTSQGVDDLKLYFRLPTKQVPRLVENLSDVADLLAASREIVFQQCLREPERRQLYFHAKSGAFLSGWLARHGFESAAGRARAIAAHLNGRRLEPWIAAFPYGQRRVHTATGTIYFHLLGGGGGGGGRGAP